MIDYKVKYFNKERLTEDFCCYVLGGDVGGTNTNLAVAGVKDKKPVLLFSLNFKTQSFESFTQPLLETLRYAKMNHDVKISSMCVGAAGVISDLHGSTRLTNAQCVIDVKDLMDKTGIKSISLLNDFQIIGFGVNHLDTNNEKDVFQIRPKLQGFSPESTRVIIGAGTGLGKSILFYDEHIKAYVPIASEGGHADFPVQNDFEKELSDFVKKTRDARQPLTYEELLSGRGIERIYLFLREKKLFPNSQYTQEVDQSDEKTILISKYQKQDPTCKETLKLFSIYYARCAKNFVLDTMATGGLYIAGGIPSKNKEIFATQEFIHEFENAYRRSHILKKTPIYLILNYDIGLYGACLAAIYHQKKQ